MLVWERTTKWRGVWLRFASLVRPHRGLDVSQYRCCCCSCCLEWPPIDFNGVLLSWTPLICSDSPLQNPLTSPDISWLNNVLLSVIVPHRCRTFFFLMTERFRPDVHKIVPHLGTADSQLVSLDFILLTQMRHVYVFHFCTFHLDEQCVVLLLRQ